MAEDENTLQVDLFQKFRLVKSQQVQFDKEIEQSSKQSKITLGVDKSSQAEEHELHLVKAVKENQKVPTKRPIKEDNYSIKGYYPSYDYYVYQINNSQQNILYDLLDEDFTFCERTDGVTVEMLEFCLTALDLMFPFKYKALSFSNEKTLIEIYEALRVIHQNPKQYCILNECDFPSFDAFTLIYHRFADRRKQYKNEPLIPILREKLQKNKYTYFMPYAEDLKKPPKTNVQLRQLNLLYNQFAEFAAVREQLNLQYYYKQYRALIEKYGFSQFENVVDIPDVPMPFRQPMRAQQVGEMIEKIKTQKQSYEVVQGAAPVIKRQGSQFSNFVMQCLEDEGSDSQ